MQAQIWACCTIRTSHHLPHLFIQTGAFSGNQIKLKRYSLLIQVHGLSSPRHLCVIFTFNSFVILCPHCHTLILFIYLLVCLFWGVYLDRGWVWFGSYRAAAAWHLWPRWSRPPSGSSRWLCSGPEPPSPLRSGYIPWLENTACYRYRFRYGDEVVGVLPGSISRFSARSASDPSASLSGLLPLSQAGDGGAVCAFRAPVLPVRCAAQGGVGKRWNRWVLRGWVIMMMMSLPLFLSVGKSRCLLVTAGRRRWAAHASLDSARFGSHGGSSGPFSSPFGSSGDSLGVSCTASR